MKVACVGPEYTFSEEAAAARFPDCETVSIEPPVWHVVEHVATGQVSCGVIPFYNLETKRSGTTFPAIYAKLAESGLYVTEVVKHRIEWCAMAHRPLGNATTIYSQEQGVGQCSKWVDRWIDGAKVVFTGSTAEAAVNASRDPASMALGSKRAAEGHGVPIRARGIQNDPNNATWFYVIGPSLHAEHDATCHTLIACRGTGPDVDQLLDLSGVEVSWTDSWVVDRDPDVALEFIELEGHCESAASQAIAALLEEHREWARIVGCYADFDRDGIVSVMQG